MKRSATVTIPQGHGFEDGDLINITIRDTRWWRRFIFWVLRRGTPWRTMQRRVTVVENASAFRVEER